MIPPTIDKIFGTSPKKKSIINELNTLINEKGANFA